MFHYTISNSCPYCGFQYRIDHSTNKNTQQYGCSLIICPVCKKGFIDKRIKEKALEELKYPTKAGVFFVSVLLGVPAGICVYILVCIINAIFSFNMTFELITRIAIIGGIAFALYLFISRLINNDEVMERIRNEYAESEKRLSVLPYAQSLQAAGFKVPERFLQNSVGDDNKQEDMNTSSSPAAETPQMNQKQMEVVEELTRETSPEMIKHQPIVFHAGIPSAKENSEKVVGFCKKCGAPVSADSEFCRKCGTRIKE